MGISIEIEGILKIGEGERRVVLEDLNGNEEFWVVVARSLGDEQFKSIGKQDL
jgi:hypothetical protein